MREQAGAGGISRGATRWARPRARRIALAALCLLGAAGGGALGAAEAGALGALPFLGVFGSYGAGAGQMENPRGIAVHQGASGPIVYIADQLNERIDALDAAGKFVLTFGAKVNATKVKEAEAGKAVSPEEENVCTAASGDLCQAAESGAAGGQMKAPIGVAADPSSGDVYVESFSNHRIEKYTPEGKFLLAFGGKVNKKKSEEAKPAAEEDLCLAGEECQAGVTAAAGTAGEGTFHAWAIGPLLAVGSEGTVYVGDENEVQKLSSEGHYLGRVELAGAGKVSALAVGPEGNLFVKSTAKAGVREYSASGSEVRALDSESTTVRGIAVSAGGDVYIVDQSPSAHVLVYGPSGELLKEGGAGRIEDEAEGIALASTGKAPATTVYVTSMISDSAAHLSLLGEAPSEGLPAPEVAAQAVAVDEPQSATLAAEINPYFGTASWYVQYGRTTAYEGGSLPAPPGSALGPPIFGNEEARLAITGLAPSTLYHYRFVAVDSAGTTYGPDATLQTLPLGQLGLPDGRGYEQVSPMLKSGNNAGASPREPRTQLMYAHASPEGNRLLYWASGPLAGAEVFSGAEEYYVATRGAGGWSSRGALPPGYGVDSQLLPVERPMELLPSEDDSAVAFAAPGSFVAANPIHGTGFFSQGIYLAGEDTAIEPAWLTAPQIASPIPPPGELYRTTEGYIAGAAADLSRIYFSYRGTLLPEDASREPYLREEPLTAPPGFYEWQGGHLSNAGEKPAGVAEGPYDPYGAVPAGLAEDPSISTVEAVRPGWLNNEVSESGAQAFFLSPEPEFCSTAAHDALAHCNVEASTKSYEECKSSGCKLSEQPAFKDPVELYVRVDGRPLLVSRDLLDGGAPAPGYAEPSGNPGGTVAVTQFSTEGALPGKESPTYIYATPDGSRVFFVSRDRLTAEAPAPGAQEEEPLGTAAKAAPKLYEFDVETQTLRYVASAEAGEVEGKRVYAPIGAILASSADGSRLVQLRYAPGQFYASGLLYWQEGKPTPIATWPEGNLTTIVTAVHTTASGGVVAFNSNAVLSPGEGADTFNNAPAHMEVYRYDAAEGQLRCLSCAPAGVPPSGEAFLSNDNGHETQAYVGRYVESRGLSANGNRVFFDTSQRLLPQVQEGQRAVYEWEAQGEGSCAQAGGCLYLLSPPSAQGPSYYLDSDAAGNNVFIATQAQLAEGDTGSSYNVFDVRVGATSSSHATPAPCLEDCQQSSAGAAQLLSGAILSGVSEASGNLVSVIAPQPAKHKSKPKKAKKGKKGKKKRRGAGHRRRKRARRARCAARRSARCRAPRRAHQARRGGAGR